MNKNLQQAVLGLAFVGAAGCAAAAAPSTTIDSGRIEGKQLASGVQAYLGIPYAAPPVRELRWREPQPAPHWDGVWHADRTGPECIQLLRRKDINHYFGEEATSEDCLYMNVWAPRNAHPGAKLPVVVFIHGGGFTVGSSGMALYGGASVAARGAVFVNFNYRLGILGFMAHPELTAESPHHASGNYGFLDQVVALQWIQRNIARFGGDPAKVTISGQSAGGASVLALTASPLAKGLFQRAFIQSGPALNDAPSLAESEQTGLQVQGAVGAKSLDEMRQLPADRIFVVQRDFQFGESGSVTVKPNVDGYFLPASVPAIYAAGKQNDVPTVAGFTADDISPSPLRLVHTLVDYRDKARQVYGDNGERFLQLYPASTDEEAAAMGRLSARHAMMEKATYALGRAHNATGKTPFYMFLFSRVQPFNPAAKPFDSPTGAYHTSDVPYWFQTQDALNLFRPTRIWGEPDRALSARMMDSLLAFARTGNPATPATQWPAWRAAEPRYVDFGNQVGVERENSAQLEFQNVPAHFVPAGAAIPRLTRD
ncbi:carboxylesterase family protein [Massilia terrae]|uniref:Carboxylic ester hydrolase n=1 Tax=Massilia terrae TaxID=1811224 RepID=A0ABT2CS28_9BURK|nr:carboxylesterase family protein [Massilia terrae]MCS0656790.1 carboxylesterase family protein [Massilia terrae]